MALPEKIGTVVGHEYLTRPYFVRVDLDTWVFQPVPGDRGGGVILRTHPDTEVEEYIRNRDYEVKL